MYPVVKHANKNVATLHFMQRKRI